MRKKSSASAGSTTLENASDLNHWETEYQRILTSKSTPRPVKLLLHQMLLALRGRIPECAVCMDQENVKNESGGYSRCEACKSLREKRNWEKYISGK